MEKTNNYSNISELIEEVEQLGDWKDESQRDAYFHILAKLATIYNGYKIGRTKDYYPSSVIDAMTNICAQKFPSKKEPFDENGNLKPGYPNYSNYLVLATTPMGISVLAERTRMDEIARENFGIDVYNGTATKEEVDALVKSCEEYLAKLSQPQ